MVVNHCLTVALVMENALVCFKQATKNGHILQDLSSCARKETKSATEIKRDANGQNMFDRWCLFGSNCWFENHKIEDSILMAILCKNYFQSL